jgi:hypothetical protein
LYLRDPTFRSLPAWMLVSAVVASALEGLRTFLARASTMGHPASTVDSAWLVLIFWLPLAAFLTFGKTHQRCSHLELTLPVPARRLWWIHVSAVAVSGILLLGVVAGVVLLRDAWLGYYTRGAIAPRSDVTALAPALLAGLLVAVAVLQTSRPGLFRIPTTRRQVLVSMAGSLILLGLLLALVALPTVFSLATVVLATIVGWRGSRAVPAGFTLIPREPDPASGRADVHPAATEARSAWERERERGAIRRRLSLSATVFGILSRGIAPGAVCKIPTGLSQLPIMFAWGLIVSGVFFGGRDLWLFFVVITAYLLLAFLGGPMNQLYLLDPLPLPRRRVFALLVLPGFLAFASGYGIGLLASPSAPGNDALIDWTAERSALAPHDRLDRPTVRVPADYLETAANGVAPLLRSPWGESHRAWSTRVARGARPVLYSPFSTPDGSSSRFVAWQLGRAIEAVYGVPLTLDEVERRFLELGADGRPDFRKDVFEGWLHERGLRPRRTVSMAPIVLTSIGLLWLLAAWAYLRAFRPTSSTASRKWTFFGVLGILLFVHLAVTIGAVGVVTEGWVAAGVSRSLTRRVVEALPAGRAAVWLAGGVLLGVAYGWVRRRFERVEVALPRATQEG